MLKGYEVIFNAYVFFLFFDRKFIFVPISPKVPNIAEFFCHETFGDIAPCRLSTNIFLAADEINCPGRCWELKNGVCYPQENKVSSK